MESCRKGMFSQDCSGSTVEICALGWHVLSLTLVILSNFNGVASQMSCLWTEPLLIGVCSRENYSIAKTKMVLSVTTFLYLLWMRLNLYSNKT